MLHGQHLEKIEWKRRKHVVNVAPDTLYPAIYTRCAGNRYSRVAKISSTILHAFAFYKLYHTNCTKGLILLVNL